jgi:hypothetical protein
MLTADRDFQFDAVPAGDYSIRISRDGFREFSASETDKPSGGLFTLFAEDQFRAADWLRGELRCCFHF